MNHKLNWNFNKKIYTQPMNKNKLMAGAFALLAMPLTAQVQPQTDRKWAPELDFYIQQPASKVMNSYSPLAINPEQASSYIVKVADAEAVVDFVTKNGFDAEAISENTVVVTIPVKFIPTLSELNEVVYVYAPQKYAPLMSKVREEIGVTKVLNGDGLDSPLSAAKDVIVGVIDQGFEYDHIAFKDRVVKYGLTPTSGSLTSTMPVSDPNDANGHATHVTNIAAGSKVNGYDCQGIASEAGLILVSSSFENAVILKQAKAIKNQAEKLDRPWVINMSFGGVIGPHDGSTSYDKDMSKLCGEGGIMVAAMGNERGQNLHAKRTFASDGEKIYLNPRPDNYDQNKMIFSQVVSESANGRMDLDVKVAIAYNGKLYYPNKQQMERAQCQLINTIDFDSQRHTITFMGSLVPLLQQLRISITRPSFFLWEVSGKKGETFHVWMDNRWYGSLQACNTAGIVAAAGDDDYLVGQGAASIPRAIAVASYNIRNSYLAMNGTTQSFDADYLGVTNGMSNFSSKGPALSNDVKPAVAAPGGAIISAYSKNSSNFNSNSKDLTKKLTVDGKNYYYGVMSGTSMASPVVTGVVALWLQANPKLTPEQIMDILKKTSRHDNFTGAADANGWNANSGYGKIDAYAGLKEALRMANETGINEVLNTEEPVSLMKSDNVWKVLFNNDESYANVRVYAINGKMVYSANLESPRRGEEHIVDLTGFEPGMYVFHVDTKLGSVTRKLVVK